MASFQKVAHELPGTGGPRRSVIKGNFSSPGGSLDMSGVLNAKPLKHERFFTPQRLYITAPLDDYGRPLREFTVQSKLLNELPPNTMCHLESFSMNNFTGFTQPNLYGAFKATITAQTLTVGATPTLTIVSNPNAITPQVTGLVTFYTAEGYHFMGWVSTATAGAPVVTIINPAAITSGSIPEHQYPVFNFNNTIAAQTVTVNYTWKEAVGSGQNDLGKLQVELLDYTNPEVFDTATGQYSHIVGVVPTSNGSSVEIDWYEPASINNAGYPVTDKNLINNRPLSFRISYATNSGNSVVPPQAGWGQVVPYNMSDMSYNPLSGGNRIPWGGSITAATGAYVTSTSQATAQVFSQQPCIRFCLVFLPMYGITTNYQ